MRCFLKPDSRWHVTAQGLLVMAIATVFLALQCLVTQPTSAVNLYSLPRIEAGDPTWVVDDAGILSRLTLGQLDDTLGALAAQTGTEVRFVTVHNLYGESAQDFTNELFDRWFPTPEDQANQVLLVLDDLTNFAGIRVGTKAMDALPVEIAQSVANATLQVPLRENKYNQGFLDAGERLAAVISGQPDPGPPEVRETVQTGSTFTNAEDTDQDSATLVVVGLLIAATVIPMVTYFLYARG